MKKSLTVLTSVLVGISVIGCSDMNKQDVGTMSGAVAGGLIGSQFGRGTGKLLGVGIGTLAGAYFGGAIGKNMDDTDRMRMNAAFEGNQAGQPAYWQNGRTGATYTVTPTRNVTLDGNPYCREYRSTANVAGKRQQVYGTACRQPDGSWQVVSNN